MDDDGPVPRRAGRGRPALLTQSELLDAVEQVGLDGFTISAVAERLGVRKSTVYNYIPSRERLYTLACTRIVERVDLVAEVPAWSDYLVEVTLRLVRLAVGHPGLGAYLVGGRYEEGTLAVFAGIGEQVRRRSPESDPGVVQALGGQVVSAAIALVRSVPPDEADVAVERLRPTVARLVDGGAAMMQSGAVPARGWEEFVASSRIESAPRRPGPIGREASRPLDLAALRAAAGLSQEQLAAAMGASQAAVSRLESAASPTFAEVMGYLSALGLAPRLVVTVDGGDRELASG